MKRVLLPLLVLVAALVSLAAQPPVDDSSLPEAERRIPPGHYCKAKDVPIGPREKNAHSCDCKMVCEFDENGHQVGDHGTSDCLSWCEKNGRRCTCHTEQPCPGTLHAQQGFVDMNGNVVVVARGK